MPIYEGNHAHEIEQVVDSATQMIKGCRCKVSRVRPINEILRTGEEPSKEAADENGCRVLQEVIRSENKEQTGRKPAA